MQYLLALGLAAIYIATALAAAAFSDISYSDYIIGMMLLQVCLLTVKQRP